LVVLFLLPCVGAIVDLVLFGFTHNHDLAAKSFLTLLDEMTKTVTYPVHLVDLGIGIWLDVIGVVMHVDIFEL
jgi:hypothetical protein